MGSCVVAFICMWCSMVISVVWPVVEDRGRIWRTVKGCVRNVRWWGKGSGKGEVETESA